MAVNIFDDDDDDVEDMIDVLDDEDDVVMLASLHKGEVGQSATMRFDRVPDEVTNTRTGLFLLWQHMVYSSSLDHFDQAWALLQRQFKTPQKRIVEYLTNNHIPIQQEWAGCWTQSYLNFGQNKTSTNGANNGSG